MRTSLQTDCPHFPLFAVPVGEHRGGVKGPCHTKGEQNGGHTENTEGYKGFLVSAISTSYQLPDCFVIAWCRKIQIHLRMIFISITVLDPKKMMLIFVPQYCYCYSLVIVSVFQYHAFDMAEWPMCCNDQQSNCLACHEILIVLPQPEV